MNIVAEWRSSGCTIRYAISMRTTADGSIHHYYKCATLTYLRKSIFFSVSTLNARFRHIDKRNAIVVDDPGIVLDEQWRPAEHTLSRCQTS